MGLIERLVRFRVGVVSGGYGDFLGGYRPFEDKNHQK